MQPTKNRTQLRNSLVTSRRTQRYLIAVGTLGVITSCVGCSLIVSNQAGQLNAARIFLIAGNIILLPLFFYLLLLRSRASATYARQLRKQEAQKQRELEALSAVGEVQSPMSNVQSRAEDTDPRPLTPDP